MLVERPRPRTARHLETLLLIVEDILSSLILMQHTRTRKNVRINIYVCMYMYIAVISLALLCVSIEKFSVASRLVTYISVMLIKGKFIVCQRARARERERDSIAFGITGLIEFFFVADSISIMIKVQMKRLARRETGGREAVRSTTTTDPAICFSPFD